VSTGDVSAHMERHQIYTLQPSKLLPLTHPHPTKIVFKKSSTLRTLCHSPPCLPAIILLTASCTPPPTPLQSGSTQPTLLCRCGH